MKRAAGFTLAELVLVLSLLGVLLGGTIGLVSIVRTSEQNAAVNRLHGRELRRLADDLRRDVRAAEEVEIQDDELILSNPTAKTKTTYRAVSGSPINRTVATENNPVTSRDSYKIASQTSVRFERFDDGRSIRWTFTDPDRPLQPIEIIATRKAPQ